MYNVTLQGQTPTSMAELRGWFANVPQELELGWERQFTLEEEPRYTGPVTKAPVGVYELWIEGGDKLINTNLAVFLTKILLAGCIVCNRDNALRVPTDKRKSWLNVMGSGSALLAVYGKAEEPKTWQYHAYRDNTDPPSGLFGLPYLGTMDDEGVIR